jgi:cysteine-rich repeat protein
MSGDGCNATCTSDETCGNGFVDPGEACDDGNTMSGDGCNATCTSDETCGNGFVDPGEACDDGNTMSGDGCNATCTSDETCGNGFVDPGETCDDGNTTPGDGCNAACQAEFCGDGTINNGGSEQCDDGNNVSGDGCSATCQLDCADADGDGYGSPGDPLCASGAATDCNDGNAAVNPGEVEDCNNTIDDDCDGLVDFDDPADCDPLAVRLISFSGSVNERGEVVLTWETALEIDTVGFRILRADDGRKADGLVQITSRPIAAQGGSFSGATYTFVDRPAGGRRVSYWLESVDRDGSTERFGPVSIDVPARTRQAPPARDRNASAQR